MNASRTALHSWALPRIQNLLPLPEEDLIQLLADVATLGSAEEVSSNLQNLLGESSESISFISDFNSRLFPQTTYPANPPPNQVTAPPSNTYYSRKKGKKQKAPLSKYPQEARKANDGIESQFGNPAGVYIKKEIEDEYYTGGSSREGSRRPTPKPSISALASTSSTSDKPLEKTRTATQTQENTNSASSSSGPQKSVTKATGGTLTSDLVNVKTKKKPVQQQKIHITGGTSMRGATNELNDLDSALRALELTTNPTLTKDEKRRGCSCMGLKHEVLAAAPNCLSCGKIICVKEGLGPCTFCGTQLISPEEIQSMVKTLREERGKEKMAINAATNKRPDVARVPKPYEVPKTGIEEDEGLKKAQAHRDKLLGFQASSAQRTKIIDQAADFETPMTAGGLNPWATPQERALQLKKQQKVMRMMEWGAKEDYEKRRVVVAIDLQGRKVVREMRNIEPEGFSSDEEEPQAQVYDEGLERGGEAAFKTGKVEKKGGQYSRNPLLGGLIRPIYEQHRAGKGKERGAEMGGGEGASGSLVGKNLIGWRRVQDDLRDNEEIILNGGSQGGKVERGTVGEEPVCG
ncbi:hypothetical protein RUND412_008015 [Rhizina undulata]